MKIVFWLSLFIVFYTFAGYGMLLYLLIRIKRIFKGKPSVPVVNDDLLPECALVVAAYNEEHFIKEKINNTLNLNYPAGKFNVVFITDGSTDKTPELISHFPQIQLLHQPERAGKIAAVHRAMTFVNSGIVVFTDANTLLNPNAIKLICRHYSDATVGAVAGEKRVHIADSADASSAGEGFYWKYESALKKWDSELYSVVGAAGELFSVRRSLYRDVRDEAILDDFMISMEIALKGYRIVYEPEAYAIETASENVTEELKRKIRIAAGGIQSILWLRRLFNVFKYPVLSFQYISHRVLRWTVTPFLLLLVFVLNAFLVLKSPELIYSVVMIAQIIFYFLAILGLIIENRHIRIKALFIPYYFCIMNYAVVMGIIRYINKNQSSAWEKAKRKT